MPNYNVTPGDEGWRVHREDGSRVSSTHATQAEAIAAAKQYSANGGGGEVSIHGRDGRIRAKDTVKPGNDPRGIPG